MSRLKEDIEERYEKRHTNKIYTWGNMLIRIILFVIVIMIIRFLSDPDTQKFRDFLMGTKTQDTEIINIKSE